MTLRRSLSKNFLSGNEARQEIFRQTEEHLLYKGERHTPTKKEDNNRARLPKGETIENRPAEVKGRETFGHWEMDSIIGKRGSKAALVVLTERLTRYGFIFRVPDHTMERKCANLVTDVVSIPVIRLTSKTEAYRQSVKPGWSTVEWYSAADGYKNPVSRDRSDKTQQLVCDEDSGTDFYTKNGGYFRISPYEEINTKEMPEQAACAAIIHSDSCGFDF